MGSLWLKVYARSLRVLRQFTEKSPLCRLFFAFLYLYRRVMGPVSITYRHEKNSDRDPLFPDLASDLSLSLNIL